ncbi:hypothetical protein [Actinophytocola xinjiangensis]|uniref:hypothetical protein n=1 Tax=Actinophytocola xinjiangensis TaxID=485602 RepID=UPI000A73127C|nr:hypothetical protein [Actinophytocola xinjiangensis]
MNVARRDVLRGLALLPVAGGLAVGTVACTEEPEPPPPPDPLADLAASARADADAATAIVSAVPALAAVAGEVAAARDEHATALRAEVDRERPPVSSSTPPSSAPPADPPADEAAARELLAGSLDAAHQQAADLVAGLPAYRAGLVGSVAAGCASLRVVLG